jgi:CheY-like chemotaxis protein
MSEERMRILVADDDPSVLRIVAAMLGRWSNHPPAEPGAFVHEPLKAAKGGR